MSLTLALATFGGGCFWCLEASFEQLVGVDQVISGYAAGHTPNPTYKQVSLGTTGHAEVIQIQYNPLVISYEKLLEVFFTIHDPTSLNRQGNDIGTQYRSIILTHDQQQQDTAQAVIANLTANHHYQQAIVTEVAPLTQFYPAENYHQNYFANHPDQAYCQLVVSPKVEKVKHSFSTQIRQLKTQ